MTQVYCRSAGGKGLSQTAWKYALKVRVAEENYAKYRERVAARGKAVTLPKLKWMEDKDGG